MQRRKHLTEQCGSVEIEDYGKSSYIFSIYLFVLCDSLDIGYVTELSLLVCHSWELCDYILFSDSISLYVY